MRLHKHILPAQLVHKHLVCLGTFSPVREEDQEQQRVVAVEESEETVVVGEQRDERGGLDEAEHEERPASPVKAQVWFW
jgi:hypothetical protein